jgi:hypothetical protein
MAKSSSAERVCKPTARKTVLAALDSKQKKAAPHTKKNSTTAVGVNKRTEYRQREAAANAEISRLRMELAILRAEGCPGYLARERQREEGSPILPKRALTLAGYWNVLSNDVLAVTPALVAAVEAKGGCVLKRQGMHLCFHGRDKALVIETVLEVMPQALPQYRRRID